MGHDRVEPVIPSSELDKNKDLIGRDALGTQCGQRLRRLGIGGFHEKGRHADPHRNNAHPIS